MPNLFNNVSKLRPGRSVFDLSYEKKFNCDMGELIPVMCDEVVPGDNFQISNELVIRWQPLIKPILHEVNVYVHYFFVPYRLLWDQWEDFITGGPDGTLEPVLPRINPIIEATGEGTLWDYLGYPIKVIPTGALPLAFPTNAYNYIWNEYYRDQTLQSEGLLTGTNIRYRAWEKDYFTSALPWQQRNPIAPSLPIVGTSSAAWEYNDELPVVTANQLAIRVDEASTGNGIGFSNAGDQIYDQFVQALNSNTVDLSTASSFDIADLREVVQIQKFLERNARVGARYTEFLGAHFGVNPRDSRLDRPEYIGGTKSPVIISEVLQTSTSGYESSPTSLTPQGNLAGHGITADRNMVGSYKVEEFGLIMGIMSVMPRPVYQQGMPRQWLRETKYDFYFPEFAHLSEQAISQAEIYASNVESENNTLFGYQGKYDEMRVKQNMICGSLRSEADVSLDYWHLGRNFAAAPILDENFITTKNSIRKDIFAVPSEKGLIVNFANKIKAVRPLPAASNPGLMDHF